MAKSSCSLREQPHIAFAGPLSGDINVYEPFVPMSDLIPPCLTGIAMFRPGHFRAAEAANRVPDGQ